MTILANRFEQADKDGVNVLDLTSGDWTIDTVPVTVDANTLNNLGDTADSDYTLREIVANTYYQPNLDGKTFVSVPITITTTSGQQALAILMSSPDQSSNSLVDAANVVVTQPTTIYALNGIIPKGHYYQVQTFGSGTVAFNPVHELVL